MSILGLREASGSDRLGFSYLEMTVQSFVNYIPVDVSNDHTLLIFISMRPQSKKGTNRIGKPHMSSIIITLIHENSQTI